MKKHIFIILIICISLIYSSCGSIKSSAGGIVVGGIIMTEIDLKGHDKNDDVLENQVTSEAETITYFHDTDEPDKSVKNENDETETVSETSITPDTTAAVTTVPEPIQTEETRSHQNETVQTTNITLKSDKNGKYFVVVNMNSMVYHTDAECSYAKKISEDNKLELYVNDYSELDENGYRICSFCAKRQQDASAAQTSESETTTINTTAKDEQPSQNAAQMYTVIINIKSKTFHIDPNCQHVKKMKDENKMTLQTDNIAELIAQGYKPCGTCAKQFKTD